MPSCAQFLLEQQQHQLRQRLWCCAEEMQRLKRKENAREKKMNQQSSLRHTSLVTQIIPKTNSLSSQMSRNFKCSQCCAKQVESSISELSLSAQANCVYFDILILPNRLWIEVVWWLLSEDVVVVIQTAREHKVQCVCKGMSPT